MNGDYDPIDTAPPQPRRPFLRKAAFPAIAFLLGLGVMGYLLAHWEAGARLLGIAAAEPPARATPRPAPQAQVQQPIVQYEPPPANPALPGTPAEQDFARRLAALEQRFGTIDTSSRVAVGSADRTEALVAVIAARRVIERGVALGFLERVLQQRFPNQPQAVGAIIAAARQPVTLVQLQSELETLGPQLMGAPPNQSWWGAFRDEVGSLIVIRRADTPSAEPSQRLERAKRWLQAGEVTAAVAEVQRMPGQGYAADWVARAGRYALAHQRLDELETAALLEPHAPPATSPPQTGAQQPPPARQPAQPTRPTRPTRQPTRPQVRPQPQPARPAVPSR
jgi:hypothetical protein